MKSTTMKTYSMVLVFSLLLATDVCEAQSKNQLFGMNDFFMPELVTVDIQTGDREFVGLFGSEFTRFNSIAIDAQGQLFSIGENLSGEPVIVQIDRLTGQASDPVILTLDGMPAPSFHASSFAPDGTLYAITFSFPNSLCTIDTVSGVVTDVGTILLDKQNGLRIPNVSFANDGQLYGFGIASGSVDVGLIRIDIETTIAEDVDPKLGSSGFFPVQGLGVAADGNIYGSTLDQLVQVNLDGTIVPIGSASYADVRGIAGVAAVLLGDVNCDQVVNLLDVEPFVETLGSAEFNTKADINRDGVVNLLDVSGFVDLINGG